MMNNSKPIYKRVIIKLSGEVLQGTENFGIDNNLLTKIIWEIKELIDIKVQIGIVIGGGNLFRGINLAKTNMSGVISDQIGMLATIMNGLALRDILHRINVKTNLVSAISISGICDSYHWFKVNNLLNDNSLVIFTAGTGNPFFTTDSAACLRALEIKAEAVLKATKVDGVFSDDPMQYPDATLYTKLRYEDALKKKLKIMDLTAFALAQDYNLPIHIFNIYKPGALRKVIMGDKEGTLMTSI